jgi:hypothetical protein
MFCKIMFVKEGCENAKKGFNVVLSSLHDRVHSKLHNKKLAVGIGLFDGSSTIKFFL